MSDYEIRDGNTRYIHRAYPHDEAVAVLADLLRPYPEGHEWRARLRLARVDEPAGTPKREVRPRGRPRKPR